MPIPKHVFMYYRKRSTLTQGDVAFILNYANSSSLSRCELGKSPPTLKLLIGYHLLFDATFTTLLHNREIRMTPIIREKINERIDYLKTCQTDRTAPYRIAYLQQAITRLTK